MNPAASTVIVYWPASTGENTKVPSEAVGTCRAEAAPCASLVSVTFAPATTAPCGSWTRPLIDPAVFCAQSGAPQIALLTAITRRTLIVSHIDLIRLIPFLPREWPAWGTHCKMLALIVFQSFPIVNIGVFDIELPERMPVQREETRCRGVRGSPVHITDPPGNVSRGPMSLSSLWFSKTRSTSARLPHPDFPIQHTPARAVAEGSGY